MIKLIVTLYVLLAFSTANGQQNKEEQFLQSRGAKVDAQIPQKQEQLNNLRQELALKKKNLSSIRSEIAIVEQEIEKASNELSRSSLILSDASRRLDVINGDLANSEKQNKEAQVSIIESSRRNQQLQEELAQEEFVGDSVIGVDPADSGAPSATVTEEAIPEATVESLENTSEVLPAEIAVLAKTTDESQDKTKQGKKAKDKTTPGQKDSEAGVVLESAKAGGEFVKKETQSVVKGAAKSAVREGIRGVLGL